MSTLLVRLPPIADEKPADPIIEEIPTPDSWQLRTLNKVYNFLYKWTIPKIG